MAQSANSVVQQAIGEPSKKNVEVPSLQVFLRIRPLVGTELEHKDDRLNFDVKALEDKFQVTIKADEVEAGAKPQTVAKSARSKIMQERMMRRRARNKHAFSTVNFDQVLTENNNNLDVYAACDPLIDHVLTKKTSMIFAYGNTGSGKTHTILGYPNDRGLYYMAAEKICDAVKALDAADPSLKPCVQVQFVEMYLDNAYDLLNDRTECRMRESGEGTFHFRKFKGKQRDGCAMDNKICVTVDQIEEVVKAGVQNRTTGSSNFHNQSSRSHAVLEMEIVCKEILSIRKKLIKYRSFWIQSCSRDKRGLPKFFKEIGRQLTFNVEGKAFKLLKWADEEVCKQKRFKTYSIAFKWVYDQWKKHHAEVLAAIPLMGGKLVLVDLAGSEHGRDTGRDLQQSVQEQREGRKINLSLMALNEVFRQKANKEKQQFRNATLTKALRDHLEDDECKNLMIATLSSSMGHKKQTVSTLNYASQLAKCG